MKFFNFGNNKTEEKRAETPSVEVPKNDEEWNNYNSLGINLFNQFGLDRTSRSLSAVYACVELISNAVSCIPLRVMQVDECGHMDVVKHHPVLRIFRNKTISTVSMQQMIKQAIQDVLIKGNGFIYIKKGVSGVVTGFRYLQASDVNIVYNEKTDTLYYLCGKVTTKRIKPEDMIHLVKNTKDGVHGQSLLNFALDSIKLAQSAEESAKMYFDSGCKIDGILTPSMQLTPKAREDIVKSWRHSGEGSTIQVLPYGMNYTSIGTNSKDAQLLETRQFNIQEICRFFGINPVLLQDLSHTTYNTLEQVNIQFLQYTLMPYIKCIEQEFTRKLFLEEDDLVVDMDEDAYLLRTDKKTTAEYFNSFVQNGVMSINEVRRELGLSDIEEGDKHLAMYQDASKANIANADKNGNEEVPAKSEEAPAPVKEEVPAKSEEENPDDSEEPVDSSTLDSSVPEDENRSKHTLTVKNYAINLM